MKRAIKWFVIAMIVGASTQFSGVQSVYFQCLNNVSDGISSLFGLSSSPDSTYYRLIRIHLLDMEDGNDVEFSTDAYIPVMVDSHASLTRARLRLDPTESILRIDDRENCTFNWRIESKNSKIDPDQSSLGALKLAGSRFILNCLEDGRAIQMPHGLMPLKEATYKKSAGMLVVRAKDNRVSQTLYFQKMRPKEIAALARRN